MTTPAPSTTPARITTLAPMTASSGILTPGATSRYGARVDATRSRSTWCRVGRGRVGPESRRAARPRRTHGLARQRSCLALSYAAAACVPGRGAGPSPGGARARRRGRRRAGPGPPTRAELVLEARHLGLRGLALLVCGGRSRCTAARSSSWRACWAAKDPRSPVSSSSARQRSRICRASSRASVTGTASGGSGATPRVKSRDQLLDVGTGLVVLEDQAAVDVAHRRVVRREVLAQPVRVIDDSGEGLAGQGVGLDGVVGLGGDPAVRAERVVHVGGPPAGHRVQHGAGLADDDVGLRRSRPRGGASVATPCPTWTTSSPISVQVSTRSRRASPDR